MKQIVFAPTNRARAIKYRQENDEAVGGFFSQIGDLYVVHHLWGECVAASETTCVWFLGKRCCLSGNGGGLLALLRQQLARYQSVNNIIAKCFARGGREFIEMSVWNEVLLNVFAAYGSLLSREETRNSAWLKEGWDANVYYTGRRDAKQPHVLPKKTHIAMFFWRLKNCVGI